MLICHANLHKVDVGLSQQHQIGLNMFFDLCCNLSINPVELFSWTATTRGICVSFRPFRCYPVGLVNLPPPKRTPLRNTGLIAGLIKGNRWFSSALNKAGLISGGVSRERGEVG